MKKTLLILIALMAVAMMVACTADGMIIDELLLKGGLKKTVTPTYTGKEAWDAAGCAEPVVKYVGTGSTTYAESTTAPTEKGTYKAIFSLEGQSSAGTIEVPFEL